MDATRTYDTRLDSKRRLTIRGALFEYYHVEEYSDGRIVLEPRVLTPPLEISQRTLSMMDNAIENFRQGQVSAPVDLSDFLTDSAVTALSTTNANPAEEKSMEDNIGGDSTVDESSTTEARV